MSAKLAERLADAAGAIGEALDALPLDDDIWDELCAAKEVVRQAAIKIAGRE